MKTEINSQKSINQENKLIIFTHFYSSCLQLKSFKVLPSFVETRSGPN